MCQSLLKNPALTGTSDTCLQLELAVTIFFLATFFFFFALNFDLKDSPVPIGNLEPSQESA